MRCRMATEGAVLIQTIIALAIGFGLFLGLLIAMMFYAIHESEQKKKKKRLAMLCPKCRDFIEGNRTEYDGIV